jgi:hypothetical protein
VVDEFEIRVHRTGHPLLVVLRRGHRVPDVLHERVAVGVQQREVELEFAGEVLV